MAGTGENEQGLRKITDMTRFISIALLIAHFYQSCYGAFLNWRINHVILDKVITAIGRAGFFYDLHRSKWIVLGFLTISLIGVKGRKDEKINIRTGLCYLVC